ncbi:hypothetical protein B0T21DRAFT_139756 [Apiosordaria backusii]|uniref:Uncharacterized protein n=1 Tax=Apiosordaria backusii TaxID=314023 RepID=A0AA40EI32_9PEZI|nr:hypothetical protein B0T21DRAFT_139756 [Apiosordaria backusii]
MTIFTSIFTGRYIHMAQPSYILFIFLHHSIPVTPLVILITNKIPTPIIYTSRLIHYQTTSNFVTLFSSIMVLLPSKHKLQLTQHETKKWRVSPSLFYSLLFLAPNKQLAVWNTNQKTQQQVSSPKSNRHNSYLNGAQTQHRKTQHTNKRRSKNEHKAKRRNNCPSKKFII